MTTNSQRNQEQEDLFRDLRFSLLQSCSWLNNEMRQVLQPYDITPKQFNILRILEERKPDSLSIQEIRELLADKMSDASRLVDRLDRKGLITKFPSDLDRRSNRARIADPGSNLLAKISRDQERLDGILNSKINRDEMQHLIDLLRRLSN